TRPGMLYGRIVRPDGYGGTLTSVDDARARAIGGVIVVRDADFLGVVAPTEIPAGERTFEASYRIPYIAHTPLEPRAAVAEWQDGKLTVWTGTQRPFGVRTELAEAFHIPEDRVRVIMPDMGSGYGGKHTGDAAIEAARLAKAAGKP